MIPTSGLKIIFGPWPVKVILARSRLVSGPAKILKAVVINDKKNAFDQRVGGVAFVILLYFP